MNPDPKLHHVANRIVPGNLEKIIEMFELLECKVIHLQSDQKWAIISQGSDFNIQVQEMAEEPVLSKTRLQSHIAFISGNPKEQIDKIEHWANESGIEFKRGSWNEQEQWFDLPKVFVDFVIEVMHRSIVE